MKSGPETDAEWAYREADRRLKKFRREWKAAGEPVVTGNGGREVQHPLFRALIRAEILADRLRESIRPSKYAGPKPRAVMTSEERTDPRLSPHSGIAAIQRQRYITRKDGTRQYLHGDAGDDGGSN